jgi:hypothetical protein
MFPQRVRDFVENWVSVQGCLKIAMARESTVRAMMLNIVEIMW